MAVTSGAAIVQSNTYDGFDNITAQTINGTTTTNYTFDALNRMASETTSAGTTCPATTHLRPWPEPVSVPRHVQRNGALAT